MSVQVLGTSQSTAQVHPEKLTKAMMSAAQQKGAAVKMGNVQAVVISDGPSHHVTGMSPHMTGMSLEVNLMLALRICALCICVLLYPLLSILTAKQPPKLSIAGSRLAKTACCFASVDARPISAAWCFACDVISVVIIALGCSLLHLEKLIITTNNMDLSFRSCVTGHVVVPLLDVSGGPC